MTERYGITFPFDGVPLLDQRPIIESLPDLGYTDLWSAESNGMDGFTPLALASVWAPRLRLGVAIIPVYTRGPATLAMSAATPEDSGLASGLVNTTQQVGGALGLAMIATLSGVILRI